MKSVLIGSVRSSKTVLTEMINIGFPVDMVFSLDEAASGNVSGYYPLHTLAEKNGIPYKKFRKIADQENIEILEKIEPDYIFVIGLSQLIPKRMIDLAKVGCVGFHPTPLPKFRGGAAVVWQMLLGIRKTKCSMFFIDEGIDRGDILGQEDYEIGDSDYFMDVSDKINDSIVILTNRVLSQILSRTLKPQKQNEEEASYLLIRRPEDGLINWNEPVEKVHRLIRAVSKPYPGAFGMYDGLHKIIIWRADYMENKKYIGIPGQICEIHDTYFDILGSDGIIRIKEYENVDDVKLFVGHKLK